MLNISPVPPFGYMLVDFSFNKTSFLTKKDNIVRIALDENLVQKEIKVVPFFFSKWFILGGILIASIIFVISIGFIGYRSISFYRQKRANNLRGESDQFKKTGL